MDSQIYRKNMRGNFITFATDFCPNGYLFYQVTSFKVHLNIVIQTSNTNPPVFINKLNLLFSIYMITLANTIPNQPKLGSKRMIYWTMA